MKKLVLGTLILTAVLLSTLDASAHSALIRAEPRPNSVVAIAPAAVTLWFDEALDTQFSSVSVLNTSRASVDVKKVQFSPDRKQMTVALSANAPPGAYTVTWRALSAADGHLTSGSYPIFVGAASMGHGTPGSLTGLEATALPLPLDVIVRWLNLLAALALSGAMTLNVLLGDSHATFVSVRKAVARRLSIWVVANLVVLFGGTVVYQVLEAAAASGQGVAEVIAQGIWLSMLTSTHFGQAALARILLADASIVLYLSSIRTIDRWRIKPLWDWRAVDLLYILLSALILLTFSLASHAASTNDPLGLTLLVDWLHLLAIGAWTGGLFALTIVLRPALHALPEATRLTLSRLILRRFSGLAVVSVSLFALTGLYAMWRQVAYANALVSTAYGQTLIIKNIMVAPLLLIGVINTLLLRPNLLARIGDWSLEVGGRRWRSPQGVVTKLQSLAASVQLPNVMLRLVRIEAVLGALVVLAAAALTALPPARTAAPPPLPPPFQATRQAGDVNISLKVEPYIVGNDTFEVKVTDSHDNPLPNVTRVNLLLTFLEGELGTANVEAAPAGNGLYKIDGGYLSVIGPWQAEAVVRRKDIEDDLRVSYGLDVIDPANNRTDELPGASPGVAVAMLDLLGGTLLLIYARRKRLVATRSMGISALMLGVALIAFSTWSTALPTPDLAATTQVVNLPTAAPPIPTLAFTPAPPGLDAQALLVKADGAMNQLSSLTELERFTNDAGMVVVSATYQYLGPDRLRFSVSNGNESIAIGGMQYYREPGSAWEKQERASAVRWPNFAYATTASQAKVDGQEVIDGEPSVVVSFKAPGVDLYRVWVGVNTGRIRRLQMVAPGHNMLSNYSQFNAPLTISAPG